MLILVVEDDPLVALSLALCLAGAGHEVLGPADRASAALDLAQRHRPDLALLDIQLRDGHTGGALAGDLRRLGIRSLFVSADTMEAHRNRNDALGFVVKPYEPHTILDAILVAEDLLAGRSPGKVPIGLELFEPVAAPMLMDAFPVLGPAALDPHIGVGQVAVGPSTADAGPPQILELGEPD